MALWRCGAACPPHLEPEDRGASAGDTAGGDGQRDIARYLVRWAALHDPLHLEAWLERLFLHRRSDVVAGALGQRFVEDLRGKLMAADKSRGLPRLKTSWRRDYKALGAT